jgi:hypothetical protein
MIYNVATSSAPARRRAGWPRAGTGGGGRATFVACRGGQRLMDLNNVAALGILNLLLNNADFANVGDSTGLQGSGSAGVFFISLHSADPGAAGNQATSEVSYTGYARASFARGTGQWTVASTTFSPNAAIVFPPCTAGTATATYAGIGLASSGAGTLLWAGPITPSIVIATGVTPELSTASTAIAS